MIPQTGTSQSDVVAAWAAKYSMAEPVVKALGLHRAFSAPVFLAALILLGVSTVLCSWGRTAAAVAKSRYLRAATHLDAHALSRRSDFDVAMRPEIDSTTAAELVQGALGTLRIRVRRSPDNVLLAVSPPWSVWGSPIFHWGLVGLIVAAFVGTLVRAEGSMLVPVGQTVHDRPSSYASLNQGPWHDWNRVKRSVAVIDFNPDLTVDGVDRGAVPTVAILDSLGKTIKRQQVYPNMKLHVGSVSVSAPGVGLTARLTMLDNSGQELMGSTTQLVGFSQTATDGTVPLNRMMLRDKSGNVALRLSATVPLTKLSSGTYGEWIPKNPSVDIVLQDGAGNLLLDAVVPVGEQVAIPGGGAIRVDDVGWFSRLAVVDDPSVPYIYASMIIACLGLTLSLLARQQVVAVAFVQRENGPVAAVRVRLWRNASTSREEIQQTLSRELGISDLVADAEDRTRPAATEGVRNDS